MRNFSIVMNNTSTSWYQESFWSNGSIDCTVRNISNEPKILRGVRLQLTICNSQNQKFATATYTGASSCIANGAGCTMHATLTYNNETIKSEDVDIPSYTGSNLFRVHDEPCTSNECWFQPRKYNNQVQELDNYKYEDSIHTFTFTDAITIPANASAILKFYVTEWKTSTYSGFGFIQRRDSDVLEEAIVKAFVWRYNGAAKKWEKVLVPKIYQNKQWVDIYSLKFRESGQWNEFLG